MPKNVENLHGQPDFDLGTFSVNSFGENFSIRPLQKEDFEQAAEIFRAVHDLHQKNRPDIYRKTDAPLSRERFCAMCADESGILLCAEQNGKILGLACAFMREIPGDAVQLPRTKAFMDDLAVLPQVRGQGIGTALLKATEEIARQRGASALELMVWSFNESAVQFYEKAGMSPRSVIMEKKF